MDNPTLGRKPKSVLPSHLLNDGSTSHSSTGVQERQRLAASIESSSYERHPLDLDNMQDGHTNGNEPYAKYQARLTRPRPHSHLSEAARDPRDELRSSTSDLATRPASPYTLNPPIDFDGLSWPSKQRGTVQNYRC